MHPLDAGEIRVLAEVINQIRNIEQYPRSGEGWRMRERPCRRRCRHAGHYNRRLRNPGVVENDWRTRHNCTAVSAAQVQGLATFRQNFARKFDTEPVPAIANAALHELRPIVACQCRDQRGFAIDQLEPDPFPGRFGIPNPTVDRSPVHRVDLTFKPTMGLECRRNLRGGPLLSG